MHLFDGVVYIVYNLLILYTVFLPERYPHGIFAVGGGPLPTQERNK